MADKSFSHLFQPLTLRHKTLKHRLTFGAHTANMAEAGLPGERHLNYYLERAIGGEAITENVRVLTASGEPELAKIWTLAEDN